MKIAYFNSSFFSSYGGAELVTANLINELTRRGENCFLLASSPAPGSGCNITAELDDRVQVYQGKFQNPLHDGDRPLRSLYRIFSYLGSSCRLLSWLARHRVDVIHQHFVSIDVVLLVIFKQLFRYRLVITFHGMELELALHSALSDWKNRLALRHADQVTAVSQRLAERLSTRYAGAQIKHIPNAIDINNINNIADTPAELSIEPKQFVFCGRVDPEKQVAELVEAFGMAIEKGCERKLYILGDGTDRLKVESVISRLGVHDQVIALGALQHHHALRLISGSLCLVLNSATEAYPMVVLEAMALGKPVIAINAATWWMALRENGIEDKVYGCGRLLREF